jgi:hypothetical protein
MMREHESNRKKERMTEKEKIKRWSINWSTSVGGNKARNEKNKQVDAKDGGWICK